MSVVLWAGVRGTTGQVPLGERAIVRAMAAHRSDALRPLEPIEGCLEYRFGLGALEVDAFETFGSEVGRDLMRWYYAALWSDHAYAERQLHRAYRKHKELQRLGLPLDTATRCLSVYSEAVELIMEGVLDDHPPYRIIADSSGIIDELVAYRLKSGDRVADVGAGSGVVATILAYEDLHVTATEVSAGFLGYQRWRHTQRRMAPVGTFAVVEGKTNSSGLPPASQDVILVRNALHHFKKPGAMLESIRAALAPGGRLVVSDVYTDSRGTGHFDACPLRISSDRALALLSEAGFLVRREERVNGWWVMEAVPRGD